MTFGTALVVIVAIIVWGNLNHGRRHRRDGGGAMRANGWSDAHQDQAPIQQLSATDPALEREVADLRKRLEVLERIATEDRKTRELADQIERLR